MTQDSDEDRIRRKAHELWVAEGHPHGRDKEHWDQAREIIAIEDSMSATLRPRTAGADEPEEPAVAVENLGDLPNLTDQGEHALTDVGREPAQLSSSSFVNSTGDTVGHVVRPKQENTPDIADPEIVSTPVAPQPSAAKPAVKAEPGAGKAVAKKAATGGGSMTKVSKPTAPAKKSTRKKG